MKPSRTFYILLQQGELYLGFAKFIVWKVRYNACWLSFYVPDEIWLCTMVAYNCHGKTKNLTAKTKYVTAKPKTSRQKQNTSRQNQKPHGKNKIPHGKTKNLTAKPNTSQQKQNSFGFAVGIWFYREVFGFCCEVFGFAVRSLVLPWGFWFCRDSCTVQFIYSGGKMWEFLNTFNIFRSSVSLLNLLPVKAFYKICLLKIT